MTGELREFVAENSIKFELKARGILRDNINAQVVFFIRAKLMGLDTE